MGLPVPGTREVRAGSSDFVAAYAGEALLQRPVALEWCRGGNEGPKTNGPVFLDASALGF